MMPAFRIAIALSLVCAAPLATREAAAGPRRMKAVTRALERRPYVARPRVTAKERARQEAETLAHLEKRLTPGRRKHELRRVEVRLRRVLREEMGVRRPLRLRSVGSELGILAGATPGGTILVSDGTENAGRIAALIGALPRGELLPTARGRSAMASRSTRRPSNASAASSAAPTPPGSSSRSERAPRRARSSAWCFSSASWRRPVRDGAGSIRTRRPSRAIGRCTGG